MNNRISIVVKINRSTKLHHFHLWLDRFPRRTIKIFPLSPIILAVSAQKSARFRILRGENCRVIHPWRVLRFRRNSRERERERERERQFPAVFRNVETTKLQLGWFYSFPPSAAVTRFLPSSVYTTR